MSSVRALNTTLSIIDGAASVLANDTVKNIAGRSARISDRAANAGNAITAFSSQTTILSRAFVDESIVDETIMPNLFRTLHEWYAAQIISALHLSQMVDGHRTVQDVMAVVQTGHNQRERGLLSNIVSRRIGQENFLASYMGEPAPHNADDAVGLESNGNDMVSNSVSIKSVSSSDNRIGPMGELYEVKLTNPSDKSSSTIVPIFIQMQPSLIPADIAPRFVDMNVAPSLWQRWTQMRAGELTFWRDFLLHRDMVKRQKSILKDPVKANAFSAFLKTVSNKDKYAIDDATDRLGSRQSANLANSVVVFSEETVAQAKADSGVDLHSPRDRLRYFRDTYTMIIVIVDPLHQRVTVYFNGLEGEINTSYNDFRPKDTKFDPKEFMTALQAFSSNNISRLR